ncbi:MAG: PspA/IM30 family protein [Alphaproteobacteria bacterium]|jgi:phage shock protein A|nr:PspA/IM30 family protein [Alphaproteobacteria bacterium]
MIVTAVESLAPEMVMEEAIREVNQAIDDVRAELGQVMTRQYHATRRLAGENKKHEELSENIRIALREKREDLAEAGVEKLLNIEAQIPVLESTIGETREAQAELEGYVAALRGRKTEMKEELREFRASQKEAAASGGDGNGPQGSDTERRVEKASEAFDRAMEIGGGIGGGDAPDRKSAAMNAELENLARKNRVNERLAQFKEQG